MINSKQFTERLNKELDNIGVPAQYNERVKAFAKIFHLNTFMARNILEGRGLTDNLLSNIAQELEISVDLLTKNNKDEKTD